MLPKRKRIWKPLFDRAHITVVVFLLACGNTIGAPFISNQNQYLAHALSASDANIGADWFRNTVDPYPFFSAVAKSIYSWGGIDGLRLSAFFGTGVAMASVFFLARLLTKQATNSNAALLAAVAIGLTLLPHTLHAFEGVAGQYIISAPAYLQPSMFGCFLLLAVPCLLAAQTARADVRSRLLALAFALTALSCALHPTYIVSAIALLVAAFVANISQDSKAHIFFFVAVAAILVAITVAANPALISMAFSSPEYSWAAKRFAFERIPYHARTIDWGLSDIVRLIIAVAAVPIARKKLNQHWLAHFLAASLIIGIATTLIVQLAGQTKLVLLFPWRISVFILPVSLTVIAVWIADHVVRALPKWKWRHIALAAASCVALFGCVSTLQAVSPAETDEKTALVRLAHPAGVGLVPLASDNVRLNAPANIYVDWKSPPYASDDLIEWWRRIDQVRQFERDASRFCSLNWHAPIRWILMPAKTKPPSCVSRWRVAAQSARWRILEEN